MSVKSKIAVALGTNLGDREENLRRALRRLKEDLIDSTRCSKIYETPPWGIAEQPKFFNAVVIGETNWKPHAALNYMKSVERELGRTSTVKNGPRLIDLDILFHGDFVLKTEGLCLPHPGISDREFVLRPLCDLEPNWKHPLINETAATLLKRITQLNGNEAIAVGELRE